MHDVFYCVIFVKNLYRQVLWRVLLGVYIRVRVCVCLYHKTSTVSCFHALCLCAGVVPLLHARPPFRLFKSVIVVMTSRMMIPHRS